MKIPFLNQTGGSRARDQDYQLTQNWYVEVSQTGKSQIVLYPTPGLTVFGNLGAGPIRGSIVFNDFLYVVAGSTVYQVNNAGGATALTGTLNTTGGRVSLAHNGQRILIADGTNGYFCTSTAVTTITDADYPDTASQCVFFDSYFIVNDPTNIGRFYISDSYATDAANSFSATSFATAERDPDGLVSIVANNRELWFIGEETAEVWYNSGALTVPFEPVQNAFSQWGCAAEYSTAEADGSVFWLSKNKQGQGQVIQTKGYNPTIISTDAIATKIAEMSVINDAFGYTYQAFRHTFYVLTFPTEAVTLVYDIATQAWHEWVSKDIGRHRGNSHSFFNGEHIIGDYTDGKLYKLDYDVYTDNGDVITRKRRSPHLHTDDKYAFHRSLRIDFKEGVGNGSETDPQAMLRFSDDGGHTWSNERWRSIGAVGEYKNKVIWRKLGRSDDRVYELTITDGVFAVVLDGYADIDTSGAENVT